MHPVMVQGICSAVIVADQSVLDLVEGMRTMFYEKMVIGCEKVKFKAHSLGVSIITHAKILASNNTIQANQIQTSEP